MGNVASAVLEALAAGGPHVGWALAVYLMVRLHQLTDRQHKANIKTVAALTVIKTVLLARRAQLLADEDD